MSSFKVGDKVRRTRCPVGSIKVGGVYTVSSVSKWGLGLKEAPGYGDFWDSRFFELADDPNDIKSGDLVKHKAVGTREVVHSIDEKVVVFEHYYPIAVRRDSFDQNYVKVPATPPHELKVGDKFRYDNAGQDHLIDGEHADQWIIKTAHGNYNFKTKKDLAWRLSVGTLTIVTSEKN